MQVNLKKNFILIRFAILSVSSQQENTVNDDIRVKYQEICQSGLGCISYEIQVST